jgi:hypothetical protein
MHHKNDNTSFNNHPSPPQIQVSHFRDDEDLDMPGEANAGRKVLLWISYSSQSPVLATIARYPHFVDPFANQR